MYITCYSDDTQLAGVLQREYGNQGFVFKDWEPGQQLPSDGFFILLTPLRHEQAYLSCDAIWKVYFQKKSPDIKLISAGFDEAEHANYLCLLHPPEYFGVLLDQAQPCSGDWKPVDSRGMNVGVLLKRFFIGHGQDSVIQSINRLKIDIDNIARDIVKEVPAQSTIEEYIRPVGLQQQWQSFIVRWENYYGWFNFLPFYKELEEIAAIIQQIQPFFKTGCEDLILFSQLEVNKGIERIKSLLDETGKYVPS